MPDVLTLLVNPSERVKWVLSPDTEDELFRFSDTIDLYFGYDPASPQPIRVTPAHLSGIAVLPETDVEMVDDETVKHLSLTTPPAAMTVGSGDTVVARTVDHRYVIFGRVMRQPDWTLTFAARILPLEVLPTPVPTATPSVPEPSTLLLFGVGGIGLLRLMRRKHKNHRKGEEGMNSTKIVILAGIGMSLLAGSVSAATLTVVRQGNGEGEVSGEGIVCGDDCLQEYPDEAIVVLKADAYDDSEFKGWLVDGNAQEGTFVIRHDMTVTAIFEKKPTVAIPEFEIIGSRPSEFDYADGFFPLYDTSGGIAGAMQGTNTVDGFEAQLTIPGKATLTIPIITSIVVPIENDCVVAYGEVFLDPVVERSKTDLFLYSFDGTLLKFVETNFGGEFYAASVANNGEFWIAGRLGDTWYDSSFVIRRYSSNGNLLWEQPLPALEPRQLVVSPDNRYGALTLRKNQEFGPNQTTLYIYDENGKIITEIELARYVYGIEFVADQTLLIHNGENWSLYQLDSLNTPIASGKFNGNLTGYSPVVIFPSDETFLIKTAVGEGISPDYHLQAIQRETGKVLAEQTFHVLFEQGFQFYRTTGRDSFEVLLNGKTITELRIPR